MARRARVTPGGLVYHVLNRSVAGLPLFRKKADFEAFERIMIEAHALHPIRILAWCMMRNHWHFILYPREEGEVTAFMRWLAHTHAMRWHVAHDTVGESPDEQARSGRDSDEYCQESSFRHRDLAAQAGKAIRGLLTSGRPAWYHARNVRFGRHEP